MNTGPTGLDGLSAAWLWGCLGTFGLDAAFFIVPIADVLEHRPPPESKGAVQGAANLLSFAGILAASAAQMLLGSVCHLSPEQAFWVCGTLALARISHRECGLLARPPRPTRLTSGSAVAAKLDGLPIPARA